MRDTSLSAIRDFLQQRRIAMIGVSRSGSEFSSKLFGDLRRNGYDVVPVNPNASEIAGVPCFPSVQAVSPAVDAALIMLPSASAAPAIRECAEAGIRRVWVYGFQGPSRIHPSALETSRDLGLTAIAGHCPYMFLPQSAFYHRFHGLILKITRAYPV